MVSYSYLKTNKKTNMNPNKVLCLDESLAWHNVTSILKNKCFTSWVRHCGWTLVFTAHQTFSRSRCFKLKGRSHESHLVWCAALWSICSHKTPPAALTPDPQLFRVHSLKAAQYFKANLSKESQRLTQFWHPDQNEMIASVISLKNMMQSLILKLKKTPNKQENNQSLEERNAELCILISSSSKWQRTK